MKAISGFLSVAVMTVLLASTSGCSKWSQDPLEGQAPDLRGGDPIPGGEKPKPGTPSENIRVDTVNSYKFQEETEGSFTIQARVLVPGYTTQIFLDNIDAFPGATFDAASGMFKWTPKMGTATGTDPVVKDLAIRVVASQVGKPQEVRTETRPMLIIRKSTQPEVVAIKIDSEIREGESSTVTVEVRDLNGGSDRDTWPYVVFTSDGSHREITPLLRWSYGRQLTNGNYQFVYSLDLTNVEVTTSSMVVGATAIAYSKAGTSSEGENFQTYVHTSFSTLESTWFEALKATKGQAIEYSFLIFDPKGELSLSRPTFQSLPSGATVDCHYRSNSSSYACVFKWTPAVDEPRDDFNFSANIRVSNSSSLDRKVESRNMNFTVRLNPAPTGVRK